MSKILAIKPITTKTGKPVILVTTVDRQHWVPYGSWVGHKYSEVLDSYVGGNFEADYFAEGDLLLSGDPVTASGIILRDFNASMNPEVVGHIAAIEQQKNADSMRAAASMFRARRIANTPVETPEQLAARLAAEALAKKPASISDNG